MKSNRCQNPPPLLSKIIFVIWSTLTTVREDRYLVKVAKQNGLLLVFSASPLLACALKLLKNRQATEATDHSACSGDNEKVPLFGSMNLTRQSCNVI